MSESHKCVNCGAEVWLGAFFEGPFLCDECHDKAAEIIETLHTELDDAKSVILLEDDDPKLIAYVKLHPEIKKK